MVQRVSKAALLLLVLAMAGSLGCGRSQPVRYYVLAPVATPSGAVAAQAVTRAPVVGVRRVEIPDYLDREAIVTRAGANEIGISDFERWGAPLRDALTQVIAENLRALLPGGRVVVSPWARTAPIEHEVDVQVVRFEGRLGADCTLAARWSVIRTAGRETVASASSTLTQPAGQDHVTLVAAKSRLLADLSREIANAITAGRR